MSPETAALVSTISIAVIGYWLLQMVSAIFQGPRDLNNGHGRIEVK